MSDTFAHDYGEAMRTSQPGPCTHHAAWDTQAEGGKLFDYTPYHVLDGDAVRALRASSAGGGLAPCENCGKMIFVPGQAEAGIVVQGLPTPPMRGVGIKPLSPSLFNCNGICNARDGISIDCPRHSPIARRPTYTWTDKDWATIEEVRRIAPFPGDYA